MFLQGSHQLRNCCLWTSFSPWKGKGARSKHQSFQVSLWPQNRTHFRWMSAVAGSNVGEAQVIGSRPLRVPWFIPLHGYTLPNPTQPYSDCPGSEKGRGRARPFRLDGIWRMVSSVIIIVIFTHLWLTTLVRGVWGGGHPLENVGHFTWVSPGCDPG